MNKKYIIILILIILIAVGLFYFYGVHGNSNKSKIGSSTITIPEGFHVVKNTSGGVELSNGTKVLVVKELSKYKNLNEMLTVYNKSHENETVITNEISQGDIPSAKTSLTIGSTNYINYWYVKNGTCYSVHTTNELADTQKVVNKIISSTRKK